jgi:hypothetical protein
VSKFIITGRSRQVLALRRKYQCFQLKKNRFATAITITTHYPQRTMCFLQIMPPLLDQIAWHLPVGFKDSLSGAIDAGGSNDPSTIVIPDKPLLHGVTANTV